MPKGSSIVQVLGSQTLESKRYRFKSHPLMTSDKALGKFISCYLT